MRPVAPLRFNADGMPTEAYYDDVFGALGYDKSPVVRKALPAAPPPLLWGVWGASSADHQQTTVAGTETTARTLSGIAGADVTKIGIFGTSDALVIGTNGSYTETRSSAPGTNTRAKTPGVGAFMAYVNGGFSTDFTFNATFADATATAAGFVTTAHSESHSYTGNVQYKNELPNGWWFEPTVGVSYSETFVDGFAIRGEVVTVQGGARFGTEVMLEGVRVQPTFTGLAYSNVHVRVGGPAVLAAANDEGQVWGKGAAKLNFLWTDQFSTWIETNIRGTSGKVDALGYGVQVGARRTF